MTEKKYHTSINGFVVPCGAEQRSCPRGAHFSQEQYQQMEENNDPRIRVTTSPADKKGYFGKAEAAYKELMRSHEINRQIDIETKKFQARVAKKLGVKNLDYTATKLNVERYQRDGQEYARKAYLEAGVNPMKVRFIIEDMSKKDNPLAPIVKRSNPRDPDLGEQTKAAAAKLKADPAYQAIVKKYATEDEKAKAISKATFDAYDYRNELRKKKKDPAVVRSNQVEKYQWAKKLYKAGVPLNAVEQQLVLLKPEQVSVDKDGKINNLWVETPDGAERIVGYDNSNAHATGNGQESGHLITESGRKIRHYTHYHSYKVSEGGTSHIMVGKSKGSPYPAEGFNLNTTYDTGD